ncbi:non-ribosomal peptide synthetase/type I polyketide synthase [Saccharopolyspora gregorii]|uniref:non-ribosomal peptide synthetase/type I polyketide synthase n=1 Tax=Saccharopolyspora gregorii TaxID=33914 RepID=UPI0021AC9810|nr:non-ribosomal peptide synthetase/type I polyketide synthase [Saccharopolyspora gregorii]
MGTESSTPPHEDKIAIIGIGCRLPGGASTPAAFWRNLAAGRDCLTPTPPDRYDIGTLRSGDPAKAGRLVGGRGGYVDGFDEFDPAFFGISPREAAHMDPQQRKLLEVTWEALEDGGQRPADLAGTDVGVFIGAFTLDYKILQFGDLDFGTLAAHTATGTMMTMVSNRISHCFDFRGPSVSIDTACSSSLVSAHLACRSLRSGESELAVVGGTSLQLAPQYTISETRGGFLSPEGLSRTFDAAADGYVRSEGVAAVVLKRLADAERDGDPIYALITGSGVNQDGRTGGITVPDGDRQAELVERVCAEAGLLPGDLQYVEAHGTSTAVGDPIEANALGRALAHGHRDGDERYVGSVKTNIGHTEAAAGVVGLIKVALAVRAGRIPPHINLNELNPAIDLAALPYRIPQRLTDWPAHDGPARAGVNSFGFGGTNAHVLVEEAPAQAPVADGPTTPSVLPISARDEDALRRRVEAVRAELDGVDETGLRDLGYTLARRRQHHAARLDVVYSSADSLRERLDAHLRGEADPRVVADRCRDGGATVWAFSGMGPQWWAMGRELFEAEPVYREAVERCHAEIRDLAGWSLVDELRTPQAETRMGETWLAQPANFAVQVGLAALWRHRGVHPDAIVGHSTGEIAAFHEAGVYSLRDATTIAIHRSRLQQRLTGTGTMLAVALDEDAALERLRGRGDRVSVAAVNGPAAITLAGDEEELRALAAELEAEHVFARQLDVRVPYHSARMDPIKDELLAALAGIRPQEARVPLHLTATEDRARGPELDAEYWWRNVREPVRFRAAVDRLITAGHRTFLEIGPHPVLAHPIRECLADAGVEGIVLPSLRRREDEVEGMLTSLAALHARGAEVDWAPLHPAGRVVALPPYPWARDRYWTEPDAVAQIRLGRVDHPLLGRRLATAEPGWELALDLERSPYLADHRIQGTVVFPAAGYVEMAAQAVRALTGDDRVLLRDLEFRRALFVADGEVGKVQLALSGEDARFTIATPGGDERRAVHASGSAGIGGDGLGDAPDWSALRGADRRRLDRESCYAALDAAGYQYGPAFRAIEQVWLGDDEALARIVPTAQARDAAEHHAHPVLLDACFQTLLVPEVLRDGSGGIGIRLPLSLAELRLDPVGDRPIWVHARITARDAGELVGRLALFAEDGTPLGRIDGFRAGEVERAGSLARRTIDNWLVEPVWQPLPAVEADGASGRWLVLADRGGVGAALAARITAGGGSCHLVRPGPRYRRGDAESELRPGDRADLGRLLDELGADGPDHVLHLWNLDPASIDALGRAEIDAQAELGGYSLIALADVLQQRRRAAELHVVTRGAQAVVPGDVVAPLGAPAWGVGRVLRQQEAVRNRGKLIDLDPGRADSAADAADVLRAVAAPDEDEIAVRGNTFRTARLRPAQDLSTPLPPVLRPDGTYLVTGAFGALGRLLCRTLIKRGARRLVLISRSGVPERVEWGNQHPDSPVGGRVRFVRELEALGAHPEVVGLDITDETALTTWLAEHRRGAPQPIRGVFHLAGNLRDALVADLDREAYRAVHDPKVVGSLLLHRHLRDEPLEHFVLFASIASLLTTAGQTNYAAGNAFLDALAHHRRALGLPALSIDWGPWATGMIEEQGLVEHYRTARGMSSLTPEGGMAVLERILGQRHAQLVVATVVDWPTFLSWYPVAPPLVAELASAADAGDAGETAGFLDVFRAADPALRRDLLTERFTALVAGVLQVPPDSVDGQDGLNALGLDSMLAMELRAQIQAELGVALPVVALLGNTPVRELVQQVHDELAESAGADAGAVAAVEVFRDEHRFPLTQNQKALWFLKQLHPDGFAYNIGGAVEVRTELDPRLLAEAFGTLVARHPSLRANFLLHRGEPVQVIAPEAVPDFAVVDVRGLPWEEVHRRIVAAYRAPYDLERDPLIRFRLFQRAPDRWVLVKAVHHIISDAISTFTFIEELLALYEGLRRGAPVELPPVAASYLDFLNRQNEFLAGPDARRMLEHWRSHLPERIEVLNLPTDKPRPLVQTHNGASEFFALDTELSARVHELAREHNVTPFVVLLSAYYLLLHRYSGQDDLIVGSPVTGRTAPEFGSVYGYFVNPLPLHAHLGGDPAVAELLDRVRTAVLGGLDNQEYPFVLLVEQLGLQHDPSRSAVFQVMFILLHHKVSAEQYGYRLDYVELPEEEGQFDLTLSVYEDEADQRFHCVFKYNTDLFLPATMRRLAGHYTALLDALTAAPPARRIAELPMLDAAEQDRILGEWSGAGREPAVGAPVHELVVAAAREHPDAIAVSHPGTDRRMSYAKLDELSARLARGLRARGVGEGSIVGLCQGKNPELIASVLAVLRAGAAYLPLDPGHPPDRLAAMVRRAGAGVVLADEPVRAVLGTAAELLTPAELAAEGAGAPAGAEVRVALDSPAYVCCTSGSTGLPKAVQVSHRNLASAQASWQREYGLGGDVRVHLQLASPAFDVFTGDLVRALSTGGTLVLVDRDLLFNTALLHRTMVRERVDCAEFVPAVVRGLVEHCESRGARLDFLRVLVVGSDVWKVEEHRRLRELCGPDTRLISSYGVTEATVDSTCFEGSTDGMEPGQPVPIGTPLPNTTCYVLDEHERPVPAGVTGELWLGGAAVATGYRGDPEQTAERFRTLSPGGEPVRCYRTGDLARWDERGVLHLLGRADSQIKVRGHRIELGEVEAHLAAWPQLKRVVVVARPDSGGETALCAYCVPVDGAELDRRGLRRHLAEHLPTFMIPAHLVELPELPLTTSGKVDLDELPAPSAARTHDHEPTTTLFEERMAAHWQALLGLDRVGLHDDFFELGGSSIKLIELIHHVQAEFDITVAVGELFKTTTLHGMAKTVEHVITGRLPGSQPYVRFGEGRGDPLCCFPPVGGHGLVYRQLAGRLPEHELIGFNYLSGDDKIARYADLVEAFQPEGACRLLGYSLGGNLAFEVAGELERRGRRVARVIIVDSYRISAPFEVGDEQLAEFERELAEHLRRHTGTDVVAEETRDQAREYLEFCGRTPNTAVLDAPITVLSDPHNLPIHLTGEEGGWQDRSRRGAEVLRGSGAHADMLDREHVGANADLVREVLAGGAADVA